MKDRTDAEAEEQTSGRVLSEHRGGTEILYLTPHMLQPVWKTVLINWLHCGMNLLFEAIMVRTVQHQAELRGCTDGVFHYTEMKLLSAAGAGRWSLHKFIQHESRIHLELYKNKYRHNDGIPWRDKFFSPTRDEYTFAANVKKRGS